jgi:hypothetical protein
METTTVIYGICRDYVLDFQTTLGVELTNRILGHLRSRNLAKLCSLSDLFEPDYHGPFVLKCLLQVEAFFKKNDQFVDEERCMAAARTSFLDAELRCAETNLRLEQFYFNQDAMHPDLRRWMARMESDISRTLGTFDQFFEDFPRRIRVTGGASATRSRRDSLPYLKIRKKLDASPDAVPYLAALSTHYGYGAVRVRSVNWNRVEAVSKNWKTHRLIACEPEGNIPLQLAFDDYVKERLRTFMDVDLSDQSKNQRLAELSSRSDGMSKPLATVDMKAASDTLALNAVAWLLPRDWFTYIMDIRSSHYRSPWGIGEYSKFSSMGNGCTFGLETLIFAAACRAIGSREYSVYGDDIIVEQNLYDDLKTLLNFIGFAINEDKTFTTGLFRESCGGDFYDGIRVTPFYVRTWSEEFQPSLCHNINGLSGISVPEGRLWERLRSLQYEHGLPLVPWSLNTEQGIHVDATTMYDLRRVRSHFRGHPWVPNYKAIVRKAPTAVVQDTRTLFLWYLDSYRLNNPELVRENALVRSRVSLQTHKYARKWVRWVEPPVVTPDHVYSWSDFVTRVPEKER